MYGAHWEVLIPMYVHDKSIFRTPKSFTCNMLEESFIQFGNGEPPVGTSTQRSTLSQESRSQIEDDRKTQEFKSDTQMSREKAEVRNGDIETPGWRIVDQTHTVRSKQFLSPPVPMHGGLLCIDLHLSVRLSV